jgi:hypothetical protein
MDWTHIFIELDAFLADEKIRCDVAEFFEAVGYRLELDDKTIIFPLETRNHVEERMLVRNPQVRGGGYFFVKSGLLPHRGWEGDWL